MLQDAGAPLNTLTDMHKIYIQDPHQQVHIEVIQALQDIGLIKHIDVCYLSKKDEEYIQNTLEKGNYIGEQWRLDKCVTMPLIDYPDL